MDLVSRVKTLLGALLVAAAMALSLPGIGAVRAEEPAVNAAAAGPICSPSGADAARELVLSREIEALQASLREQQERGAAQREADPADASPANGVVVLNTSGYNYGAGHGVGHRSTARVPRPDASPAAPR